MNLAILLLRYYWPVSVLVLASGSFKHTHVQVTGIVSYTVATESDGDTHIKLVSIYPDSTHAFIIAECIPKLPCRHPKTGDTITVRGISRYDPEHHWYEVHPVEELLP